MVSKKLITTLGKLFPRRIAMEGDFIGRQVGKLKEETKKILVCLDFDRFLLPAAIEFKPDLIITHHPFIYGIKKEIFLADPAKKSLADDLEEMVGSPIYSYHTNFDGGVGGMNDTIAVMLGLQEIYTPIECGMMRIGYLPTPMGMEAFAYHAMETLSATYSTYIHDGNDTINKVAIIAGGGSSMFKVALKEEADIFVSGDFSHHIRRDIVNASFNYLDLPHEIERVFIARMKEILLSIDPSLEVLALDHELEAKPLIR